MSVVTIHKSGISEDEMIDEMASDGFEAAAKAYTGGKTEPHQHDYDVCLYILAGEFKLTDVAKSAIHRFGPGDKAFVERGTVHAEEYGSLRMIVGRRH